MFDNDVGAGREDPFDGPWGDDPPSGVPVFILTHPHGNCSKWTAERRFYFVTDGIKCALEQAREAVEDELMWVDVSFHQ